MVHLLRKTDPQGRNNYRVHWSFPDGSTSTSYSYAPTPAEAIEQVLAARHWLDETQVARLTATAQVEELTGLALFDW